MGLNIENQLADAGYKMLGADEKNEKLILSILNTSNIRYLKAIPFLIYNQNPNLNHIYKRTKSKKLFCAIISITHKIFSEFKIPTIIPISILSRSMSQADYELKFKLNYSEFRDEFEMQLRNEQKPELLINKQKIYAERNLQMYLSQIFTKKEKQIIKRILEEKPISRTDYEYYSRKTKKKFQSIISLQEFAQTLYALAPKYDESLFNLKKMIEKWLESYRKTKDISIDKYHIFDSDSLFIMFKEGSSQRLINTIVKLKEIKDKEILRLLDVYRECDFR
ncbi:MAG: hypothetical protein U9R34_04385 [Nanoarchaeota archaeon]|nr:hypothetical protein [Nanoarchaeota archaeon]